MSQAGFWNWPTECTKTKRHQRGLPNLGTVLADETTARSHLNAAYPVPWLNIMFQCTLVTCQNPSLPWCCRSRRWLAHSAPPRWLGGVQTYTRCRVAYICSAGTPGTPPAGASANPSRSASCSCWPWPYWCQLSPPFGVRGNSEGWGSQEGAYYSLGLRETEWRKLTRRCSRVKY